MSNFDEELHEKAIRFDGLVDKLKALADEYDGKGYYDAEYHESAYDEHHLS